MRHAGTGTYGARLRALIVVLSRAGRRINEALALGESDLDTRRGSVLVRAGNGGRRRVVGMDDSAQEQLQPWLTARVELPIGPRRRPSAGHRHRPDLGGRSCGAYLAQLCRARGFVVSATSAAAPARASTTI